MASGVAILKDPRLRALYDRLRGRGKSMGRARRGVADRLLAMLVAMLNANELYDAERRTLARADASPAAGAH